MAEFHRAGKHHAGGQSGQNTIEPNLESALVLVS